MLSTSEVLVVDARKPRLVVIEQVYFQEAGRQPVQLVESRYSRQLTTDEQPYGPRRFTATEKWQPLATGWVKACGTLIVTNDAGLNSNRQSSDLEQKAIANRIVELGTTGHDGINGEALLLIHPGQSQRLHPAGTGVLWVRSRSGEVPCTLTAIAE